MRVDLLYFFSSSSWLDFLISYSFFFPFACLIYFLFVFLFLISFSWRALAFISFLFLLFLRDCSSYIYYFFRLIYFLMGFCSFFSFCIFSFISFLLLSLAHPSLPSISLHQEIFPWGAVSSLLLTYLLYTWISHSKEDSLWGFPFFSWGVRLKSFWYQVWFKMSFYYFRCGDECSWILPYLNS